MRTIPNASIMLLLGFSVLLSASDKVTNRPPLLAAKTVSFITFETGANAEKLKSEATTFFTKWKHYQVIDDPSKADLLVLLGPMPRHVNGDAWDAVLAGKSSPVAADTKNAPQEFAV